MEGGALLVGQRPGAGGAPAIVLLQIIGVVGHRILVHDAVVDALQPVVEEAQFLDQDVKAGVVEDRCPVAVGGRPENDLARIGDVVEGEGRSITGALFVPVGGRIDGDAGRIDLLAVGVRAALEPPLIAEVLCHAVAEGRIAGGLDVVLVLGDGSIEHLARIITVHGNGRAITH